MNSRHFYYYTESFNDFMNMKLYNEINCLTFIIRAFLTFRSTISVTQLLNLCMTLYTFQYKTEKLQVYTADR